MSSNQNEPLQRRHIELRADYWYNSLRCGVVVLRHIDRSPVSPTRVEASGQFHQPQQQVAPMYYVYILRSLANGELYTDSTNNIDRRFSEHNAGLSKYT